jgi:hypothetical protein
MKKLLLVAFGGVLLGCILVAGSAVQADPCLVVYPQGKCVYQYDPNEYYTVRLGDPLYDPRYDRGGEVLIELGTNDIDESIYQAPNLIGFEPSTIDEGYVFGETDFTLIIDGFSNKPTTFVNILVKFDKTVPRSCVPEIEVNGQKLSGMVYQGGDLVVSTPTPEGYNYSDTMSLHVVWHGCFGMHVWAFSDVNYNGQKDGGECFTAFSHDVTIPVGGSTWGAVKALFQ